MSFDTDPKEEQDAEMYAAFAAKDKRIAELELAVDDLAALVQRLVRAIHTANPSNTFAEKALDYLQRKGLQGNPLRADKT